MKSKSTIKLFKAIKINYHEKENPSNELLKETIKRGFVFSPDVIANYTENQLRNIINIIENEVGLTSEKLNSSFHKSWEKVKNASKEQLFLEQIMHYITTYGFQNLGIYNEDSIYIPNEKIEIPEIQDNINLVVIKGYTEPEIKGKLRTLLESGIALDENTINDVIQVALDVEINENHIECINNKEVRTMLYDYLDMIPEKPEEFLRFVIYKVTGKTLLIKDNNTIEEIKCSPVTLNINKLFIKYKQKHGLQELARIFYRHKPIFLALKANEQINNIINKIRKLAKKYHNPMSENYLNSITARIKRGEILDEFELNRQLEGVNTFRKIRLAYALQYRIKDTDSIMYRIRNGKAYATKFNFEEKGYTQRILNIVRESIIKDISENVKGYKFYIPDDIVYTIPATEKQFTENLPSGSYIKINKDMIFGIHWHNDNGDQIDLDLSMINAERKMGWDASKRTENRDILFSGDMTSAPKPHGASELYYIQTKNEDANIVFVNYYNFEPEKEIPFKIVVGKEEPKKFDMGYMINPNNIIASAKTTIKQKQKILGLLVTNHDECRFHFTETNLGKSITSSNSDFIENARKYLYHYCTNIISLNEILKESGAELVENKEKADIDLSPENLEKDTIINLINKK